MTDITNLLTDETPNPPLADVPTVRLADAPDNGVHVGHAIPQPPTNEGSEAWLDQRRQGIGGSDAPVVLGLQPYETTRQEVWREKTGRRTEDDWVGASAKHYGHRAEAMIRQHLRRRSEDTPARFGDFANLRRVTRQLAHPDRPWQRANIDGLARGVRMNGETKDLVVEIKTSTHPHDHYKGPEWREDGVRRDHYAQIQHYLAVTGLDEARYVYFEVPFDRSSALHIDERFIADDDTEAYWRWIVDKGELTIVEVERDASYIDDLVEAERRFWQCVQDDTEPDAYMPEGTVVVDDDELADLLDEYGRTHAELKAHEAPPSLKNQKNKLKQRIKDRAQSLSAAHDDVEEIHIEGTDDRVYWHGSGYWRADPADRQPTVDDDAPF